MHSGLKTFFIFLIGIVVGVGASVLSVLFLFNSTAGQNLVQSYIVSQEKWPDINAQLSQSVPVSGSTAGTSTPRTPEQILNTPITIAAPKAYASQAYVTALTSTVSDLQALATSTNQLGPLLVSMNAKSLSGDFSGFFNLVVQAKVLVAQQKQIAASYAQHLTALTAANQQTPDAITKSMTLTLISAATPIQSDLVSYTGFLDQLLSGSVPSPDVVTGLNASGKQLGADITAFGAVFAPLSQRFKDYASGHPAQ